MAGRFPCHEEPTSLAATGPWTTRALNASPAERSGSRESEVHDGPARCDAGFFIGWFDAAADGAAFHVQDQTAQPLLGGHRFGGRVSLSRSLQAGHNRGDPPPHG